MSSWIRGATSLIEHADALAWDHGLRGYDAVQLAAALACGDMIGALGTDVVLATFDSRLREAAARAGLMTWPP